MIFKNILLVFSTSFMALFPVINPLGISFIVNSFLTDLNKKQRKSAIEKLIINFLLISIGILLVGHLFLSLFGLAIPVIQLGGGILICKTALGLLTDNDSSTKASQQELDSGNFKWKELEKKLFYPITFPISIDPGSISVIFTLMASTSVKANLLQTSINYLIIALAIISIASILYILLTQGRKIMEKLGPKGNLIINKLIAFFTFCVGIQITVLGIASVFHIKVL